LNTVQYAKIFNYITSPGFQKSVKDRFNDSRSIQNTIKDSLGVAIKMEDIITLIRFHSANNEQGENDYGYESPIKRS